MVDEVNIATKGCKRYNTVGSRRAANGRPYDRHKGLNCRGRRLRRPERRTVTDIFINGVSVSNRKLDLVLPKGFISIIDENIDLSMFGDVINFLEV